MKRRGKGSRMTMFDAPTPTPHVVGPAPRYNLLQLSLFIGRSVEALYEPTNFVFIAEPSTTTYQAGYLMPAHWTGDMVPAVRVTISGSWNKNPLSIIHGSMDASFGWLRCASIKGWKRKILLKELWVSKFWSKVRRCFDALNLKPPFGGDVPPGIDFHPLLSIDDRMTATERFYLAIVALWPYWESEYVPNKVRPDDLNAIGFGKAAAFRKKAGKR